MVFDLTIKWMEFPYLGKFQSQVWMLLCLLQGKYLSPTPHSHPSHPPLKMLMSYFSLLCIRTVAYIPHQGLVETLRILLLSRSQTLMMVMVSRL